jgi:glycosyltransferase involved in cell wall biosynthesis
VGRKLALPAIRHECYKGYLRTASVVASNAYAHWRGIWSNSIDGYIAVSSFVKEQLVAGGFPSEKIFVKPNFIFDTGAGAGLGEYALFVGRLTVEKGVQTLLAAWAKIGTKVPLKIIGEGPLQSLVEASAARNEGIEYLGRKTLNEVCDYLASAKFLVFPAEWPEPFGRSIIEAYSKGTPVIGAKTAPVQDMIEDGHTGVLYRSGDCDGLAETVLALAANYKLLNLMRSNARQRYLRDYTEEANYKLMVEIIGKILPQSNISTPQMD